MFQNLRLDTTGPAGKLQSQVLTCSILWNRKSSNVDSRFDVNSIYPSIQDVLTEESRRLLCVLKMVRSAPIIVFKSTILEDAKSRVAFTLPGLVFQVVYGILAWLWTCLWMSNMDCWRLWWDLRRVSTQTDTECQSRVTVCLTQETCPR